MHKLTSSARAIAAEFDQPTGYDNSLSDDLEFGQVSWTLRQMADELDSLRITAAGYKECADVLTFQQKFHVPMAKAPTFLDAKAFQFRLKFLQEELDEFARDHAAGDMHGAADALVDLAYVLHGTALMMGLPWAPLWNEVQRANMAKVRATHAGESKRGSALDVVKPEGWKAPDHTTALGVGPWPVLETESTR